MQREEFENMELKDQVEYLNKLCSEGNDIKAIEAEIGMTQREMGALGLYYVRDKFMGKPMRGYQTAKRSGNEYAAKEGGWRNDDEITDQGSAARTSIS